MVSEAEHDEEVAEGQPRALQNLEDVEAWIKEVKHSGARTVCVLRRHVLHSGARMGDTR